MNNLNQRGSALIISLIIIIILMLLGITAMNTSNTAYKLAGNLQFANTAMNNAEAVLGEVESLMKEGTINNTHADFFTAAAVITSATGLYPIGSAIDPLNTLWDNTDSVLTPSGAGRAIIQLMSTNTIQIGSSVTVGGPLSYACNKVNTYRITARSTSTRGASKHIQSYFSALTPC